MIKKELLVRSELGLHARPCAKICDIAKRFGGTSISIKRVETGEKADAKSILSIMMLGVAGGESVELSVNGENEGSIFKELIEVIESSTME